MSIDEVFHHYCSGGDSTRKKIFNSAYVTPKENDISHEITKYHFNIYKRDAEEFYKDLQVKSEIAINASIETIKKFAKYLCDTAKLPKNNTFYDNANKKLLFLTGAYGEGKSFLINYIITVLQDDLFEEENIITVKIDLGKPNKEEETIQEKIYRQVIKILKYKYFTPVRTQAEPRLKLNDLNNYIVNTNQQKEYQYIIDEIALPSIEQSIIFDKDRLREAYRILKNFVSYYSVENKNNYNFIIIIDGLDSYSFS